MRSIRGALGSVTAVSLYLGLLLGYITGAFMDYEHIPYLFMIIGIVFIVSFSFMPETPMFLMSKGKEKVMHLKWSRNGTGF